MKIIFFICLLFYSITLSADVKNSKFITTQVDLVYKINDSNATQEKIENLLVEQHRLYETALNTMMADKDTFLTKLNLYENEIFSIKKIISINKRAGNNYAVLRDEVQLKIYRVLKNQNIMVKDVLQALNSDSVDEYASALNKYVEVNRQSMKEIYSEDYHSYLDISSNSAILNEAQTNIKEFYALWEVNLDIVNYLYKFQNKMYSLNKYSKYHLISFVVYINALPLVEMIDPLLYSYSLSVMKLLFILFLILLVYFFRKIVYVAIENYILKIASLRKYSEELLAVQRGPLNLLALVINLNMILYVHNSFSTNATLASAFNVIYAFFLTVIVYRVVNAIAGIKLKNVTSLEAKMKNDLINVGIKILNFIILMIGLLIMLYFAGVDLTAVLSGLGIGAIAVAYAAKDTISNFFGTVSVLVSDVFSQGDWVNVNGQEGIVVEIGLRVTTIRTFDNALIAVPNGTFATANVKNWSKRTLGRRIKMSIGVKYDSKVSDIKNAVIEIRTMLENHPNIATKDTQHEHRRYRVTKLVSADDLEGVKKTLLVYLDEFGPSSINILVYCFSKSVVWNEWLETKEDVMHKIMEIMEKNNLEFAFPSLSIYNEKMDGE